MAYTVTLLNSLTDSSSRPVFVAPGTSLATFKKDNGIEQNGVVRVNRQTVGDSYAIQDGDFITVSASNVKAA